MDEFAEPVADLLPSVERLFREEIAATAYLSGGTKPGFVVHWDPHDTIAIQLVGRKIWRLQRPDAGRAPGARPHRGQTGRVNRRRRTS